MRDSISSTSNIDRNYLAVTKCVRICLCIDINLIIRQQSICTDLKCSTWIIYATYFWKCNNICVRKNGCTIIRCVDPIKYDRAFKCLIWCKRTEVKVLETSNWFHRVRESVGIEIRRFLDNYSCAHYFKSAQKDTRLSSLCSDFNFEFINSWTSIINCFEFYLSIGSYYWRIFKISWWSR
jgi:hypothetical protein